MFPHRVNESNMTFEILKPYLDKNNIVMEIRNEVSLFVVFVNRGNIEVVRYLISLGVDVNSIYLAIAPTVFKDDFNMFKFLLDNGANYKTLFSLKMNNEFRRELYSRMKDINESDTAGKTLLFNAIKCEDYDLARELINKGAKLPTLCAVPDCLLVKKTFNLTTEEDKRNAIREILALF